MRNLAVALFWAVAVNPAFWLMGYIIYNYGHL